MKDFYNRFEVLESCKNEIEETAELLIKMYENGGKLLICGNGGSCADSDHIVGELMKGFMLKRRDKGALLEKLQKCGFEDASFIAENVQMGLPAISLCTHSGLISAYANDEKSELVYAQQVIGYGKENDTLLALSTSGNSKNVVYAAKVAKALGLRVIAITGSKESKLSEMSDVCIRVPETETFKIQELTLPTYHYLCQRLEYHFFGE